MINLKEEILIKVKKPAQYLGNELNVVKKNFDKTYIRFALCFPDIYEIGMSNLGFRIIYGLLNSIEDVVCERVFLPEPDLEEFLNKERIGMFSWESKKKLIDFDIIGFSLSYELNYTGILKILELAGIPFFSNERKDDYPLIIGGGFCTLNPEPIADFFDLFIIGEAEEILLELIEIYRNLKKKNKDRFPSKEVSLHQFKYLKGIYIPSFYKVSYNRDVTIKEFSPVSKDVPTSVKKCFLENLENSFYPCSWIIPFTEIVHDRVTLEIMRGCPHNCRFCQARMFYFPLRYRSIDRILEISKEIFFKTGYEEFSLGGLSVSDYPQLKVLLERLNQEFKAKNLIFSLSSLREKLIIAEFVSIFKMIKKSSFTFAPEVGSQKLRKIINKDFRIDDFLTIIEKASQIGFRHLKLYFMIGLPTEENKDLDSIFELADASYEVMRRGNKKVSINISINTFIPKPHTPFQWLGMETYDKIREKQLYIFYKAKSRRWLKVDFHNYGMSFLECLLSRANRRFSQVIYKAYKKGACFDAWSSFFSFSIWQEALKEVDINPELYVKQSLDKEKILPWDFVDVGISKDYLWQDFCNSQIID